ncbi:MAG: glycosyltransferase family 4 protein [Synechococcaceae cyanobacterium SM2_3_1]|nr:glycosyltransferase family 4 protein [Synechococcaceae cyanobacterium SM2_3_1]
MQRFTQMLEIGLSEIGHEVKVIRPHPLLRRFDIAPFSVQKLLGYFDKYIAFPFAHEFKSYVEWADLVHIIDHSNSIYIPYIKHKKYLLTCNDLLAIRSAFGDFPQNPTGPSGKILQRWILNNINKAKYVACISESTKNDLLRISEISRDNTSVVYMGLNYKYSSNLKAIVNIAGYDLRSITYFLHVGGNQWYKNRLGVLSVYKRLLDRTSGGYPKLVMVGKPFSSKLERFIRENSLHDHVISLVSVPNEQLEELYSNAIALLFPSLMEALDGQ